MQIEITPEQDQIIRLGIEQGRYQDEAEAVRSALDSWVERERERLELIAAIEEGEQSLEEDGGIVLETKENIQNFFNGITEIGRERLEAIRNAEL